jgi:hypothetical protein
MFATRDKANDIESTMSEIFALEKRQAAGEDVDQELAKKRTRLQQITKEDPTAKALLQQTEYVEKLLKAIQDELKREMIEDPNNPGSMIPKYPGGKSNLELLKESKRRFYIFFQKQPEDTETKAEGGRIGYQDAGSVMPAAGDMGQETMPDELQQNLTFEELRNRLPQEIGDDIINLILSSAEAMEDFATIQTEQDISNFNKKYGVNLVLPSEG